GRVAQEALHHQQVGDFVVGDQHAQAERGGILGVGHRPSLAPRAAAINDGRAVGAGYQVKGAALRAYVKDLARKGWLAAVKARVGEPTRALLDAPPPSSSWMDGEPIELLMAAVDELHGEDAVRQLSHDANSEMVPLLRPLIEGTLRLFGASPATIFSRLELLTRNSLRGCEFKWRAETDASGEIEVHFVSRRQLPRRSFVSFVGSFEVVIELCGKKGTVSSPDLLAGGAGARFAVAWRK